MQIAQLGREIREGASGLQSMSARVKELEVAKSYDAKVGMVGQRKQHESGEDVQRTLHQFRLRFEAGQRKHSDEIDQAYRQMEGMQSEIKNLRMDALANEGQSGGGGRRQKPQLEYDGGEEGGMVANGGVAVADRGLVKAMQNRMALLEESVQELTQESNKAAGREQERGAEKWNKQFQSEQEMQNREVVANRISELGHAVQNAQAHVDSNNNKVG
jgi:hypothetical protein